LGENKPKGAYHSDELGVNLLVSGKELRKIKINLDQIFQYKTNLKWDGFNFSIHLMKILTTQLFDLFLHLNNWVAEPKTKENFKGPSQIS